MPTYPRLTRLCHHEVPKKLNSYPRGTHRGSGASTWVGISSCPQNKGSRTIGTIRGMSDNLERAPSTSLSTTLSHCVTSVASSPRQPRPRAQSLTSMSAHQFRPRAKSFSKSIKAAPSQSHLQSVVSLFSCRGRESSGADHDCRHTAELDAAKQEIALLQEELDDMCLLNNALLKDLAIPTTSRALQQAQDDLPSANEIGLKQEVRQSAPLFSESVSVLPNFWKLISDQTTGTKMSRVHHHHVWHDRFMIEPHGRCPGTDRPWNTLRLVVHKSHTIMHPNSQALATTYCAFCRLKISSIDFASAYMAPRKSLPTWGMSYVQFGSSSACVLSGKHNKRIEERHQQEQDVARFFESRQNSSRKRGKNEHFMPRVVCFKLLLLYVSQGLCVYARECVCTCMCIRVCI